MAAGASTAYSAIRLSQAHSFGLLKSQRVEMPRPTAYSRALAVIERKNGKVPIILKFVGLQPMKR